MNYKGISKSSIRSSASSSKSLYQSDEITKLERIIETLGSNNEILKKTVENKDKIITTLENEKEKLNEELKCTQRTNRNLYQQLTDEREIHFKEKEFLVEDIRRLSIRRDSNLTIEDHGHKLFSSLEQEIEERDEIIYNICNKYLKVKSSKLALQRKLVTMHKQSKKTCESIILILQENRRALDALLNTLLQTTHVSKSTKKFIKLLKINSSLLYENTQLKVRLICSNKVSLKKGLSMPYIFASEDKLSLTKKSKCHYASCANTDYLLSHSEDYCENPNFLTVPITCMPRIYKSTSDSNLLMLGKTCSYIKAK